MHNFLQKRLGTLVMQKQQYNMVYMVAHANVKNCPQMEIRIIF